MTNWIANNDSGASVRAKLNSIPNDGTVATSAMMIGKAYAILSSPSQPNDGETVTIGTKVYTFQTTLTNVNGHVQIGADYVASNTNLLSAINLTGTPGTDYAAATTINLDVIARTINNRTFVWVDAIVPGAAGNSVAVATNVFGASWLADTVNNTPTAHLLDGGSFLDATGNVFPEHGGWNRPGVKGLLSAFFGPLAGEFGQGWINVGGWDVYPGYETYRANGARGSETPVTAGNTIGQFVMSAWADVNLGFVRGIEIIGRAAENWSATKFAAILRIRTVDQITDDFPRDRIGVDANGNVVIGTSPTSVKPGTGNLYVAGAVTTTPVIVASLPSAATLGAGARSFVTDALFPSIGAAVVGGGSVAAPVYSDGSAWLVDAAIFDATKQPTAVQGYAGSTFDMSTNPSDGQTVTIGAKVYTFQTTLTNVDGHVLADASAVATSLQNLVDAINLTGTPGTQYAAATTINADVTATLLQPTNGSGFFVSALVGGTSGNSTATSTNVTGASWDGATLSMGGPLFAAAISGVMPDPGGSNNIGANGPLNVFMGPSVGSNGLPIWNWVGWSGSPLLKFYRANGTRGAETGLLAGNRISERRLGGWDPDRGQFYVAGNEYFFAAEDWHINNHAIGWALRMRSLDGTIAYRAGVDGAGNLVVGDPTTAQPGKGNIYASGNVIKSATVTVSALPSAATLGAGARSFVTDATAPAFGVAVVGGGAVNSPVYSDGATWLVG